VGYSARDHSRPSFRKMEPNSRAEDLPTLYRAILDRVAQLEAAGDRSEARRVRQSATAAYSRAWDDRAHRELESLLRRAERPTADERVLGRGRARGLDRAIGGQRRRTASAQDR
jgi:hypothetical protein